MRILVTGVNGQLGHDVMNELIARGHYGVGADITSEYNGISDNSNVTKADYVELDITDKNAVKKVVGSLNLDAIIHCAAWTAVDAAEEESNKEKVMLVNGEGTKNIAFAIAELNKNRIAFGKTKCKLLYISTDYVFNGQGKEPWEAECKEYEPLNVYGESKLAGELAVKSLIDTFFIVRIAWVFGLNGKNFVKTMINAGKTYDEVRVIDDQIGTPTYTLDLSRLLIDMIESQKYGYYHATNSGSGNDDDYISWNDFTVEIYKQAGIKTKVIPVSTAEYGLSKAKRPFNSRLDKSKLIENGFEPLPSWKDAIGRYLEVLSDYKKKN